MHRRILNNIKNRLLLNSLISLGILFILSFVSCSESSKNFLTQEEITWLKNNKNKFDLLMGYDAPPEAYYDENGKYQGLMVDFYHEIEENIGYQFNSKNVKTWDSLINYAKTNTNYIVVGIARTKDREKYIRFTNSFVKIPYVIITRRNSGISSLMDLKNKKVCTVENYAVNDYLKEYSTNIVPLHVTDELTGLRGVSSGDYDAMLIGQLHCTYIIEEQGITNLRIAGESGYFNRLSVGVSRKNQMLFEILDKAINHIDKARQREIYSKWVSSNKILPKKAIKLITISIILILSVFLVHWIWLASLKRQVNKKTRQIKEGESRYRLLIENSNDAIYQIFKGRFIMVNRQFEELFGYSQGKVLESDFDIFTITAPESMDHIKKIVNDFYKKNIHPSKYEFIGLTKEKEKRYLEVSVSYLDYEGGIASQGIIRDITPRKEREIELLSAKEKAEESDRLKSAFLANMSHEIRTPMNGILGFTELLNSPDLTGEEQKKFIDVIRRSGERMLNTINDIIDVSRIETGQVVVHYSDIDINNKLRNLYSFFKPEAEKKGIVLTCKPGSPLGEFIVKTDKSKFESILTNLIKNAIKFTNKGNIDFGYDISSGLLIFYVKDTGIGIPLERQKAIFNRFEQADIEDKEALQGSGLGLSIAKAYVEMLGGEISVESKEGIGSKFYFTIPLSTLKDNPISELNTTEKNKPANGLPLLNILIVEDDKVSASYLKVILGNISKEISIVSNGKEAIDICRKSTDIDLILMDIKMPDIDGLETTRKIREFNKDIMIIAQTAFALSGDKEKTIDAGCNDYITKPIKQRELIDKIVVNLNKKAS